MYKNFTYICCGSAVLWSFLCLLPLLAIVYYLTGDITFGCNKLYFKQSGDDPPQENYVLNFYCWNWAIKWCQNLSSLDRIMALCLRVSPARLLLCFACSFVRHTFLSPRFIPYQILSTFPNADRGTATQRNRNNTLVYSKFSVQFCVKM
jgi:hypothetical protein